MYRYRRLSFSAVAHWRALWLDSWPLCKGSCLVLTHDCSLNTEFFSLFPFFLFSLFLKGKYLCTRARMSLPVPLCLPSPLLKPLSSDISASRGRDSSWQRRRSVYIQNGMNFGAPFFFEYFGTVFHSYEGILLPGPHSLTSPPHHPSVSTALFLWSLNWNQLSVSTSPICSLAVNL